MTSHTSRVVKGWGSGQTCAYCHGFAKIPPLIRGAGGKFHVNPDFLMVKRFSVRAEPFGATLAAGATGDFSFTAPPERVNQGDFLVNEFLALFNPDSTRNLSVEFLAQQTDKVFQNAPVFNTLIFGNSHLNCCLPCCTLIQAGNTLTLRVTNNGATPVDVSITARGKRFLPEDDELRQAMLDYWNSIPSYPFFLTLDDQEVTVPTGGAPVDANMTIQGTGDFEPKWTRCEVLTPAGAPGDPNAILVTVFEQTGRALQDEALPLGAFVATPTLAVAGFPGGLYRAASAAHCPPATQLFKRNQRMRHRFTNTSGGDLVVRLTYAGCFHTVDECPPGRSMRRTRSVEETIGPSVKPRISCEVPAPLVQPIRNPQPVVVRRAALRPNSSGRVHYAPGQQYWDPIARTFRRA